MTQRTEGATIGFGATLSTIGASTVLRLPETASKNLPSRGQVAVRGTINGVEFGTVLEPDGNSGHWMRVDDTLQHAAGISAGASPVNSAIATSDFAPATVAAQDRLTEPREDPVVRFPSWGCGRGPRLRRLRIVWRVS